MINRRVKLRWRRKIRYSRRHVEDIGLQAEEQLEQHLFRRLTRLAEVRRFVAAWLLMIILLCTAVVMQTMTLSGYYQGVGPAPGGTYTEGMVGTFSNANPIYAAGLVDSSVSRLMFSSLLKYNTENNLVGDLAESWTIDPAGKVYTLKLRPNLVWHDDRPLTADDVVFTFQTIQNPDAKSPLFASWRGITVKAIDDRTVTFTLSNSFAPFIYSLTTGIVPKHILGNIEAAQLRSSQFNNARPVGSGPFKWNTLETLGNSPETREQHIGLTANPRYHMGAPALEQFVIKTFTNDEQLLESFEKQQVTAIVGMNKLPDELVNKEGINEHSLTLTAETMVFLKTDSELLKDVKVRQALVHAVNVGETVKGLGYPVVVADQPLLRGQLGYNPTLAQLPTNIDQANKLLTDAGWIATQPGQVRTKNDTKLELKLVAQNNSDYIYLTKQLQKAWSAIGVTTNVTLLPSNELQVAVTGRNYDALIYGISMGTDPDVFAYWHSTQADQRAASRLNLSNYSSVTADKALEAGRSRIDRELRAAKYLPFLQSWRNDAPAIALYQPRFLYIVKGQLAGFDQKIINTAPDRYSDVEKWMVKQEHTLKTVE